MHLVTELLQPGTASASLLAAAGLLLGLLHGLAFAREQPGITPLCRRAACLWQVGFVWLAVLAWAALGLRLDLAGPWPRLGLGLLLAGLAALALRRHQAEPEAPAGAWTLCRPGPPRDPRTSISGNGPVELIVIEDGPVPAFRLHFTGQPVEEEPPLLSYRPAGHDDGDGYRVTISRGLRRGASSIRLDHPPPAPELDPAFGPVEAIADAVPDRRFPARLLVPAPAVLAVLLICLRLHGIAPAICLTLGPLLAPVALRLAPRRPMEALVRSASPLSSSLIGLAAACLALAPG